MTNSTSIIAVDTVFSNYVGKGNFLSSYPDAVAAYSMRTIASGRYVGPLVRVRRGSDQVEKDFYAHAGAINTDELKAFIGVASGFVTVWYDQSGNGNHAFQPVTTAQPMIAKYGTVILYSGKNCVMFAGNGDCLQLPQSVVTPFISGVNDLSIFTACTPKNGAQAFTFLSMAGTDQVTPTSNDLILCQANATYPSTGTHSAGISIQKISGLPTPLYRYTVGSGAPVADSPLVIGITRDNGTVTINDTKTTSTTANMNVGQQKLVIGTIGAIRRGINLTLDPNNVDSKIAELIIYKKSYQSVISNIINEIAEYYGV
ncbi:arabinofuranosidase catalytic domain-containing protein [Serratia fonticola]|uniref:arabinofuranosidase catalytic domain-containing protein n=1 Tax=Serratia fonticola TaxID=47917 RepID=UPI003AAE908A